MDKNIFDAVGKTGGAKKKEASSTPAPQTKPKEQVNIDPEIKEMLQKMQDMSDDLENQLETFRQKGKNSKVNVSLLLENTGILSKQQYEEMQKKKDELIEKIAKAIPAKSCLKKKQKSKEELTQERKGKLRGARNKWIPVR